MLLLSGSSQSNQESVPAIGFSYILPPFLIDTLKNCGLTLDIDTIKDSVILVLIVLITLVLIGRPIVECIKMAMRQLQIVLSKSGAVDVTSKRHGGELVASVLKSHGVQNVFTLSGGHISPILVGAENVGIRVIDTRHEVTAVFAADAVARVTGVPGVACVTAGPGLTNTVTAVKNAQMAESPVVLFGGCAATLAKGRGALQDIDQMSLFKSITKWQTTVQTVRDLIPSVREAFKQAQSGTPGPVFVELPLDILYPYPVVSKEFVGSSTGSGLRSKIVAWYLSKYANNLFANAFDTNVDTSPLALDIPMPKGSQVKEAADLIVSGKKPLILLGSQSVLPPVQAEALRKTIQSIGIPCFLGGMSRGLLGANSEIQMRQDRKMALKEADVVIMGGMVADFRLGYGRTLSPKSKIVAVNRDKGQLYKNAGIFWNPTLALQADVGSFFNQLLDELNSRGYQAPKEWLDHLRARDSSKESKNVEMAAKPADKYLNPVKVLSELDTIFNENTYLIGDGGDFVATAAYIVHPRGPLKWLDPGAFGTLGCGAGFAIGIKSVKPDADVIGIFGDGSIGYSLMEIDTMVRHNLPITAVVGNDACWTQIAREQKPMLGSDVACRLTFADYEKAAIGLGAIGIKVDDKDNDRLKEVFAKAVQATREAKKPVLVNVLIGKTSFREGSISV